MTLVPTLYHADWVLPVTAPPIPDGALLVGADGRIAAVGPRAAVDAPEDVHIVDLGSAVLLPGLVNVHGHAELAMFRGALEGLPFHDWITRLVGTKRSSLTDADHLAAARWTAVEAIRAGITTLACTESSSSAVRALGEGGLRGVVFIESFGPDPSVAEDSIAVLRRAVREAREDANDLVRIGVSPHAPYTVSDDLYRAVTALALEEKLPMALHIAESAAERSLVVQGDGAFAPGLGVLTGETGAGKSILLDALGLVLGNRAETALVRTGEEQANVTATFEFVELPQPIRTALAEAEVELEPGEPLILRRRVRADGGSKAWVNDQPVGAALLREMAPALVELHGQHDDRGLVNPRGHRLLLDRYVGADVAGIEDAWAKWRAAEARLAAARAEIEQAKADQDLLLAHLARLDKLVEENQASADFGRFDELLALDNSQDMLNQARATIAGQQMDNVRFVLGETRHAVEQGIRCDLLVYDMVLHHIASPWEAFQDAARILEAEGILLLIELSPHDQDWVRESCGDLWLGFDNSDLDTWATEAGLASGPRVYLGLRNGFQVQMRVFTKSRPHPEGN